MRTAVVRIGVDPAGQLSAEELRAGMAALIELIGEAGADVIENELAAMPPSRREVELLMTGAEPSALQQWGIQLCTKAFGTSPVAGVVTFVSRGTDDDARGVLSGFGLVGDIERVPGDGPDGPGWDTVHVTLRKAALERVPESRVHTALEASLNCEVHIRIV